MTLPEGNFPDQQQLVFGDVVLVPFPFTDQTASKRRPAVVISSKTYNDARSDVVLMAITSQLRATAAYAEVWVTEWGAAGLLKPSAIKPVIATLEARLVLRQLGALLEADARALYSALEGIIGAPRVVAIASA